MMEHLARQLIGQPGQNILGGTTIVESIQGLGKFVGLDGFMMLPKAHQNFVGRS